MMKKLDQQDALFKGFTTSGTRKQRHDVLNHEDSNYLSFSFTYIRLSSKAMDLTAPSFHLGPRKMHVSFYRSETVNSKSFIGTVLLRIKRKFELTYAL